MLFADIWLKIKLIAAEVGAVLVAIATFSVIAYVKGRKAANAKAASQEAEANQKADQEIAQEIQQREDIDHATDQLPEAPDQTVATADPATAAGKLRDDGWAH